MVSFTGLYVEPGAYARFKPTTAFPVIPGGQRVPAIIGAGVAYKTVSGEVIVSDSVSDTLDNYASAITSVTDSVSYLPYSETTDYQLTTGEVAWRSIAATCKGTAIGTSGYAVTGLTFKVTIDNFPEFTCTFTTANLISGITVASQIQAAIGTNIATVAYGTDEVVTITSKTTKNSQITIGTGTANTLLGFAEGATYTGTVAPVKNATITGTTNAPYSGLNTKTLILTIDGGTVLPTITFGATDDTLTEVINAINAVTVTGNPATPAVASASEDGKHLIITSARGLGSSILVGAGTANLILGFTPAQTASATFSSIDVDYQYAKVTADYDPMYYFSLADIILDYGEPSATNTLALGAQLAFLNGATVVLACQIDPSVTATLLAYRYALEKIQLKDCNIVVAMSGDVNLVPYLKAHVDQMSSMLERKERTAIIGLDNSPSITVVENLANLSLADKRCMLVYPPTVRLLDYAGDEISIGGYTLAAAIAGVRCNPNYDVAEPLTRKQILGFTEITDGLLRSQKNELASKGVTIVEMIAGITRVRHGLTTDMTTAQNQEYSVTEITDYVATVVRSLLEQMYVGQKILNETPAMVSATTSVILLNLITSQIITERKDVSAVQNASDPREIDVKFAFKPVYPLNWIYIEFSISST